MINTVLGEKNKNDLGICSSHEHIFIDMKMCVDEPKEKNQLFYKKFDATLRGEVCLDPYAVWDNALIDDFDISLDEIKKFHSYGGNTIVDCTLDEIGRDAEKLKKISSLSNVNIVMGCGHYYKKAHYQYVKDATIESLALEMINDVEKGVKNTGIKAGVIGEIGTSANMFEDEIKVLHAAGIAGEKTKKAIHIHTDLYTENGDEIIRILTSHGVKPEKICIDHVDVKIRPDYIKRLLDKGVYVEFDNFGKEFFVTKDRRFAYDLERIKTLKELIDLGYQDKIMVCNDVCLKSMLSYYGGNGYYHILKTVKAMAQEYGIDEKIYNKILSDNVANFLD